MEALEDAGARIAGRPDLVNHWLHNDFQWSGFLNDTVPMEEGQSSHSQKKRSLSRSSSYRQSTLSGDTPKAWGSKHAAAMLEAGIYMETQKDATIAEDDARLCKDILDTPYQLPDEWSFKAENFLTILNLALYRSERRVVRDVGPHVMPSPELLKERGHPGLEHIAEAVDAQWTKCTSLCGPKSKPDVSHGLSRSVFTRQEREKLTANNTCSCETMMFPFYICEAKCFDKSIEESELQALHGASVASNAVLQLYEKISAVEELNRRILAFSVSHNQRLVKIFAHFALIDGGKISFHRHRLFETDLLVDESNRHSPYRIALGIWKHFYPIHVGRIRGALARQRSRAMDSFTAQLGLEEVPSSGISTPSSSQEDSPIIVKLQQENSRLLSYMLEQQEESRQHRIEAAEQLKQMQRRSERQSEQHKEQVELQSEQHKEQLERQSEQHKEQMEQQKEIIALLRASRS